MSESISKSVRFIAKLLELTQEGRLKWRKVPEEKYSAHLDEKILVIYSTRRRMNKPADSSKTTASWLKPPVYKTFITLELLNMDESFAFKFENTAGLSDLLQSVAFSASNVDEFIDRVLDI